MQSFREFVEQAIAANVLWEVMEWDVKHGPTQAQLDAFQLLTPGFHKPIPGSGLKDHCKECGKPLSDDQVSHCSPECILLGVEKARNLQPFYFTFGTGHHDANHESLGDKFVIVKAPTQSMARIIFQDLRGDKFSSCYNHVVGKGIVSKYRLTELPFEELTPQDGPTR